MARSKSRTTIAMPWERRSAWLRGVFAGSRIRPAVLALGAGLVALWLYRTAAAREAERVTLANIDETQRAVSAFRVEVGRCPRSTTELVHPPRTRHRYLDAVPTDGFGRPLRVRCPGHLDSLEADVLSAGPSGDFFIDDNLP